MVQTLAALLSWIAMLALISIAVLLSGIWRPRAGGSAPPQRTAQSPSADQVQAKSEALALADARRREQRRQRAA